MAATARARSWCPRFAILDPLLEQLAIAITDALRDGHAIAMEYNDGLYIDTIAQMMAVHLAPHPFLALAAGAHPSRQAAGRLENAARDRIYRGQSGRRPESASHGRGSGHQPVYLARAFKAAVGQSPHQYVLARRIERAKELLRNTDLPVVDVALSSGFSSQSHLSHWFIRQVGVSPAVYRRQASA